MQIDLADCIEWQKSTNNSGYGSQMFEGRVQLAHRVAWQKKHGPIPKGMCICHHCDNRKCVNPDHLFIGTHSDNTQDCYDKGRHSHRVSIGGRNPNAKITEQTAIRIKMLHGLGMSTIIAKALNLTPAQVCHIMSGKAWKHVTATTRYALA